MRLKAKPDSAHIWLSDQVIPFEKPSTRYHRESSWAFLFVDSKAFRGLAQDRVSKLNKELHVPSQRFMRSLIVATVKTSATIDLSLSPNHLEEQRLANSAACAFVKEVFRFWNESYGLACQVRR